MTAVRPRKGIKFKYLYRHMSHPPRHVSVGTRHCRVLLVTLTKFENMIVPKWHVTNPPVGGGDLATVDTNKSRKIEEGNVEEKTTFKLQVNK
jgi:hypothetical protein